jgi:hypothetical protein
MKLLKQLMATPVMAIYAMVFFVFLFLLAVSVLMLDLLDTTYNAIHGKKINKNYFKFLS